MLFIQMSHGVSPHWKGATNPNENWIQKAIESVRTVIVGIFQGIYTEQEISKYQEQLDLLLIETIIYREKGVIDFDI